MGSFKHFYSGSETGVVSLSPQEVPEACWFQIDVNSAATGSVVVSVNPGSGRSWAVETVSCPVDVESAPVMVFGMPDSIVLTPSLGGGAYSYSVKQMSGVR